MSQLNKLNAFINAFFKDHADNDLSSMELIEVWMADRNQTAFKMLIPKKKRISDPNKPKRPISSYLFWCKHERSTIKNDEPDLNSKEATIELGKRWNLIKNDVDVTAEYTELAVQDKIRYKEDMKYYDVNDVTNEDGKQKKQKKQKDPKKPKRNSSAYLIFCKEERKNVSESNPELKGKDIMYELGIRWANIKNNDEYAKFQQLAVEDKERYTREMDNYIEPLSVSESSDNSEVVKKKEKKEKKIKRPSNSYVLFCKEERIKINEEITDIQNIEMTRELGVRWNNVKEKDSEEYAKFKKLAVEDKERYELEKENALLAEPPQEIEEPPQEIEEPPQAIEEPPQAIEEESPSGGIKNKKKGYQLYCKENRQILKTENKGMVASDISNLLAIGWRKLDQKEKYKYNNSK
jgi:hypothetical protein